MEAGIIGVAQFTPGEATEMNTSGKASIVTTATVYVDTEGGITIAFFDRDAREVRISIARSTWMDLRRAVDSAAAQVSSEAMFRGYNKS